MTTPHESLPSSESPRLDCHVVLTGFMGTGKTTVGRLIAKELGAEFVDTDAVIEDRHGPIAEIFRQRGEAEFRRREREVARELADTVPQVIATGGKLMLDQENEAALASGARVFCLVASTDTVMARVLADDIVNDRPLLVGDDVRERVERMLAERAEGYARFEQIDTDGKSPEVVAAEILDRLNPAPS